MKIYFRGIAKLSSYEANSTDGKPIKHADAIQLVRESLTESKEFFKEPILALIQGGKL